MNNVPMQIQFLDFTAKNPAWAGNLEYFQDTALQFSDTHIIKERKQEAFGRNFVVVSFFARYSGQNADGKLQSFVEMQAEKDARNLL